VTTCHLDLTARDSSAQSHDRELGFCSRTLAQLHGRDRYVLNGIDPADYIYSESKDDYFLFMSTMDWGTQKGLDVVLSLSERWASGCDCRHRQDYESIHRVQEMCRKVNAEYVGDVRGKRRQSCLPARKHFSFPPK